MAAIPIIVPAVVQFPTPPPPTTTTTTPPPHSTTTPRTPFSAVAPHRFLPLTRPQTHTTLETIYEEETSPDESINQTSGGSSSSPAAFLSKNPTCSSEVRKPWSSLNRRDCRCA
ncbi:hypothetical protein U1Q18_009639 [Sarracenia purpurea var. burkii]